MQLLQQGLSERVIRAIIAVDGYRIGRLRTVLATEIDTLHTRRERLLPCRAFTEEDLTCFKSHCAT
ncbi:hypothetical protein GQ600_9326 [Phytophthora cactorum]|nr:hypothetical protein GQ600_9326 [Phytophthora cactorum]